MITSLPGQLYVVVNAAYKSDDMTHIADRLGAGYTIEMLEEHALIALQGPLAAACLGKWDKGVTHLRFLQAGRFRLADIDCLVHRCGYTGGDGFEISLDAADAPTFAAMLLEDTAVEPVGLGARDTLRLEAGLCLAGTDFDGTITPVEAALNWVIAQKYRREPRIPARFPGADLILRQLAHGVTRRRVGLASQGRIPVRPGTALLCGDRQVGHVTSGSYGPSAGTPIAMGYVESEFVETGSELQVVIRGRSHPIRVADLPFVPYSYHRS
jgi:aminomethyltransferase